MSYEEWLKQRRAKQLKALEQTAAPMGDPDATQKLAADEVFARSIEKQRRKLAKIKSAKQDVGIA